MEKSETLQQALVAVQQGVKAPKSEYNKFGNYNYRTTEQIMAAAKPLLEAHGLLLTISDRVEQVGDRFYVVAMARLLKDGESLSLEAYAREAPEKKGMDEAQVTGSASSYARKLALCGLFLIDNEKDPDEEAHVRTMEADAVADFMSCDSREAFEAAYKRWREKFNLQGSDRVAIVCQDVARKYPKSK